MRKHVIFITASPVIFLADLEVVATAPVVVLKPAKPDLPKVTEEIIQASYSLSFEMMATAEEMKRLAKAIEETKTLDPIEQDRPVYRPRWDARRRQLAKGHARPIYWHRIRSNPG